MQTVTGAVFAFVNCCVGLGWYKGLGFANVDGFGTGMGHNIMLSNVDCQWNYDSTVRGQFWTIMNIANERLSVELSECD